MTSSQPPSIQDLKRTLVAAGLEIYRTRPDAVHLAERPRDNQILDAGISVRPAPAPGKEGALEVRVVMRAQRSDFPRDPIETMYERVRELAQHDIVAQGFSEVETREQRMADPGDKTKTLDTWYELVFSRNFDDAPSAIAEVKRVLVLEKFVKGATG
ncbi:MAG: hypothetical protein ACXWUG_12565 [Polyangiales bacterium]